MQMLITVAIVGVAITAMGVGFLGQMLNLMVQGLIVGETNLSPPITKAKVDFIISRTSYDFHGTTMMRNVIDQCVVNAPYQVVAKDSTIICKLTDMNHNVVAEGKTLLSTQLLTNQAVHIPITNLFLLNNGFPSNDVTNIFDVTIVVVGPKMTTH